MSKYLIHTNPKRLWYVNDYLIPSLLDQGICRTDVLIYNDHKQQGSLQAYIDSFDQIDLEGYTWHLQDDIIVSPDFKQVTEEKEADNLIVCGFNSYYDQKAKCGSVKNDEMWYSFPCIGIPNKVGKDCMEWIQKYMIGNPVYKNYWSSGNCIDWFFKQYIKSKDTKCRVLNLVPNIVDHVDHLLGGSTLRNTPRVVPARSQYWEYPELVEELKNKLREKH